LLLDDGLLGMAMLMEMELEVGWLGGQ